MKSIPTFPHRCYFLILVVLSNIRLSSHHSPDNSVNFNDAEARISHMEESFGKVYYGDIPRSFKIEEEVALNLTATILRPFNGYAIFFNETHFALYKPNQELEWMKNEDGLQFGPMNSKGFWGLGKFNRNTSAKFTLLANYLITNGQLELNLNITQNITEGKEWQFIQIFEWETELFACFKTKANTLVVMRFKDVPENSKEYGTFISSFYVETLTNPSALFLPSYQEPMLYYSRYIDVTNVTFYGLNLKDAIQKTDDGFQMCEKEGHFPSNFFKLQPYIASLSQEYFGTNTGECKNEIPTFYFNQTREYFKYDSMYAQTITLDVYHVGVKLDVKIFTYIESQGSNHFDIRCNLDAYGNGSEPCTKRKIQYQVEDLFVSNYWSFDSFALTRWFKTGEMKKYRLLDCKYFPSCSSCTLYGGFNCQWNSLTCNELYDQHEQFEKRVDNKSKLVSNSPIPCYVNVTASKKRIEDDQMELMIELPYELDIRAGEEASVFLDDVRFSDVQYVGDGIYRAITASSTPSEASIVISRGDYHMNNPFLITREIDPGTPFVIFLTAMIIFLALATSYTAYFIIKDNHRGLDQFESSTTSSSPVTIAGMPSKSSSLDPKMKERIRAIMSNSTAHR